MIRWVLKNETGRKGICLKSLIEKGLTDKAVTKS
jgi:hypothetical protein